MRCPFLSFRLDELLVLIKVMNFFEVFKEAVGERRVYGDCVYMAVAGARCLALRLCAGDDVAIGAVIFMDRVNSNKNVTEREQFTQMKMLLSEVSHAGRRQNECE